MNLYNNIYLKGYLTIFMICGSLNAAIPEFVIFVASYNNENYVLENLESVCYQKSSKPYHVICVNDCSTDNTGKIMDQYVKENHLESKVTIIHNSIRVGVVANNYNIIHQVPDDVVVVNVDGDDLLPHNKVLLRLEKEYKDPDVWLTYGSGMGFPTESRVSYHVPDKVFYEKRIRSYRFITSHLRTFKAKLFKQIKKEDLFYEGNFIQTAGDVAMFLPMLEMAGPTDKKSKIHSRFIKDILYRYRNNNPLSDGFINLQAQIDVEMYVRSKEPYKSLDLFL